MKEKKMRFSKAVKDGLLKVGTLVKTNANWHSTEPKSFVGMVGYITDKIIYIYNNDPDRTGSRPYKPTYKIVTPDYKNSWAVVKSNQRAWVIIKGKAKVVKETIPTIAGFEITRINKKGLMIGCTFVSWKKAESIMNLRPK